MGISGERKSPIRPCPLCNSQYPEWVGDESTGMTPGEVDEYVSALRKKYDDVVTFRLDQLTKNLTPDSS